MGKKRVPSRVLAEVSRLAIDRKRELERELALMGIIPSERRPEPRRGRAPVDQIISSGPAPKHMDILCVRTGKVTHYRLSKRDRAIRKRQDKTRRRRR